MKIRLLISLSGADFTLARGDVTERFDDEAAKRLIAAGIAQAVAGAEPEKPADTVITAKMTPEAFQDRIALAKPQQEAGP